MPNLILSFMFVVKLSILFMRFKILLLLLVFVIMLTLQMTMMMFLTFHHFESFKFLIFFKLGFVILIHKH
jgi:hypothetical protein